jgi:hypothetical protein
MIAILNTRMGAKLTGTFLGIELGALVLLTVLGLAHPVQSLSTLVTAPRAVISGALATPSLRIGGARNHRSIVRNGRRRSSDLFSARRYTIRRVSVDW